jgi:hypothetical protein
MSFLFHRNILKKTNSNSTETKELETKFVKELRLLKCEYQENKRREIVKKFIERVRVLFKTIIKQESEIGNYSVSRNNLTITNYGYELLTNTDKITISDNIKEIFFGYYTSLKIDCNSVDIFMTWEDAKDGFWKDNNYAYESKMVADNYNKLPYLIDTLDTSIPVEPPEEIIDHIMDYIKTSTKKYGSVPRQYRYVFPHVAGNVEENANYRETMNKVIENLPTEFHCIKGTFQRTSKNAIISFTLEFNIEI